MIADFTVAGESHTDHKDQWKDCENHNTKNRKCQQGPVQSLVNECFQILFDGVDMFPFLCTALYLVSVFILTRQIIKKRTVIKIVATP